MIIYITRNVLNGKIYVGQKRAESGSYIGGGVKIKDALKALGRKAFSHEILLKNDMSRAEANLWEKFFIKLFNAQDPECGYNIENGGTSFDRHTDEMRKHLSQKKLGNNWNKGRKCSVLNRQKVEEARRRAKGTKLSNDHIQKIRESRIRNNKGSLSKRKISKDLFERIVAEYNNGGMVTAIAKRFQLSQPFVSKLINNDRLYANWKIDFSPKKRCKCAPSL